MDLSMSTQSDASTCTYCLKVKPDVRIAAGVDKPACEECAGIVQRALEARGYEAKPVQPAAETQLPQSWERDAQKAAERAAMSVRSQYECTMRALSKDSKDRERAYWLDSFPCPSWCAYPETHRNGDQPDERIHDGDPLAVTFATEEPSTAFAEFRAPEMKLFLLQGYREAEPRVHLEKEGEPVAWATLDEAEQLAFHLLDLVRQARGQDSPAVLQYDSEGHCVVKTDCTVCNIEASA